MIQKINDCIEGTKEDLAKGYILTNPLLEREYAKLVGRIEGLQFLQTVLETEEDERHD